MITTVIFDLDDTLYPETDYCLSGFRAVADFMVRRFPAASGESLYNVMLKEFQSGNRWEIFNAALDSCGITYDVDCITTLVGAYRDHHPTIVLPAESRKALDELAPRYKLALLTDGFLPAQRLKVKALGIEQYFRSIIYTEELGRENWKPSPLGFQKIMFDLNVEANECVYVGDNEEKDFIAPNALGMVSIKLARPDSVHTAAATDLEAMPLHTIYGVEELGRLLRSL